MRLRKIRQIGTSRFRNYATIWHKRKRQKEELQKVPRSRFRGCSRRESSGSSGRWRIQRSQAILFQRRQSPPRPLPPLVVSQTKRKASCIVTREYEHTKGA